MKNIVVCCDGTSNEYGDHNTNVVKLFDILEKSANQVAFYDPGVGTMAAPQALTRTARFLTKVFGLAFGAGIILNIGDAYRFLMETYEKDDRVFIFGFSRGAYTARGVAAMLYKVGLLEPRNENLVPYALKMFRHERRPRIYAGFRRTFSRRCGVHFLGLWDTVKSVGWIYNPLNLQFTARNRAVAVVRHAMAVDERRCFFRQNLWGEPYSYQDVKQVWFPGVHCDVGGSYPEKESGLSQLSLKWMVDEAVEAGLRVDRNRLEKVLPEEDLYDEDETADGGTERVLTAAAPDWRGMTHKSLKGKWWIPEYLPKLYWDPKDEYKRKFKIPLAERRHIRPGSTLHWSVVKRVESRELGYDPPNLPDSYEVEPPREG